jgi:hypothetical protein
MEQELCIVRLTAETTLKAEIFALGCSKGNLKGRENRLQSQAGLSMSCNECFVLQSKLPTRPQTGRLAQYTLPTSASHKATKAWSGCRNSCGYPIRDLSTTRQDKGWLLARSLWTPSYCSSTTCISPFFNPR